MKQSPIFTRTYDLLKWLIPVTAKFPRKQRFVMAEVIQRDAIQLQERFIEASFAQDPRSFLDQADITLAKLRTHLRLCHDLDLLSKGQYQYAARMVTEIGKLLGGWKKSLPVQ